MAKKAFAGNIHARLSSGVPATGMANTAVDVMIFAMKSSTAMHVRSSVSTLLAISARPAFLNWGVSDLVASRLNARVRNNA